MGYNICLKMDIGPSEHEIADCGNYTYNVSAMYRKAFNDETGIYCIHEMQASAAIPIISSAIKSMLDNQSGYKDMAPKNGWGSYSGAIKYLEDILYHCKHFKLAFIVIT